MSIIIPRMIACIHTPLASEKRCVDELARETHEQLAC
jgi:hypothetical protein